MTRSTIPATLFLLLLVTSVAADETVCQDDFAGKLGPGWKWIREDRPTWRVSNAALEIRVVPGNLWGRANNVKNVLVRAAPDAGSGGVEVAVAIANRPTNQFEQANLAWYYDDSNMVKLGLELVNGETCIVMGREQADKTRTLAKIPIQATSVEVRLRVKGDQISGQYRTAGSDRWLDAATGDLPVVSGMPASISLHCYEGPPDADHWARFSAFRIRRIAP
jgi:regulation of enolase protein 1 (concanavalin A-like superfamily)